jgi:hypothetical protein
MFNFGAAVDVATDDCLFMAGPSRTSEATAKVFVPSVRSPTHRTKTFSKGGSPLSDFVNANIIQAFPGRNQFADPTWQVATTRPCLMRGFWISKFRMDLWIGSTLGGLVGGLSELPPQFIKPLFV